MAEDTVIITLFFKVIISKGLTSKSNFSFPVKFRILNFINIFTIYSKLADTIKTHVSISFSIDIINGIFPERINTKRQLNETSHYSYFVYQENIQRPYREGLFFCLLPFCCCYTSQLLSTDSQYFRLQQHQKQLMINNSSCSTTSVIQITQREGSGQVH